MGVGSGAHARLRSRFTLWAVTPERRDNMGFFDDIGQIETTGGGNRLGPGVYPALRVKSTSVHTGFHGSRFVAELEVIESDGPDATPVGATGSWTARIDGTWGHIGKGDVKAFVAACSGVNPRDEAAVNALVTPALMADVVDNNALEGKAVASEAWHHTTKSGQTITKHSWTSADSVAPAAAPPPPPVPAAAAFPPAGWTAHPTAPGFFYKGTEVLSEAQLRAKVGA